MILLLDNEYDKPLESINESDVPPMFELDNILKQLISESISNVLVTDESLFIYFFFFFFFVNVVNDELKILLIFQLNDSNQMNIL